MKDPFRIIEFCIVLLTAAFATFFYLDNIHASKKEFLEAELELKLQILDNELKRDHFARRRYEQLIQDGEATSNDFIRYDYLMLEISNRQSEKELVKKQIADLE
jgi:hypothetical protein